MASNSYYTETPRTLSQAIAQKALADAEMAARWAAQDAQAAQDAERRAFAAQHPQIGELCRQGRPVFYVNTPTYREAADPRDLIDPRAEGRKAIGTYPVYCPYADGTAEAAEWRAGFEQAEAEELREMNRGEV